MPRTPISRRDFVADTSKLALGAMIVPRHVLGGIGFKPPSATLNVAFVGIGGMGMQNMRQLLGENVVAICDVDFPYVERALFNETRAREVPENATAEQRTQAQRRAEESAKLKAAYEKAAKYGDWREMLEKQRDIDAVLIATPDHTHAIIANHFMKAGKHVYVQKPLTWSVAEARTLARTAKEKGVVTQMGNQGHSREGTRRIMDWIAAGVIGPVREVHIFTDRPQRFWAQGIPRPGQQNAQGGRGGGGGGGQGSGRGQGAGRGGQAAPPPQPPGPPAAPRWNVATVNTAVLRAMEANPQSPPEGMNWDLFLGPAQEIPYHPVYHPFSWRGWVDFGTGALGDMGAHLVDQPYWALGLGFPTSVSASGTPWGGSANNPASFPVATTVQYEFAARGSQPPVKMFWYDGAMLPPRPPFLPDDMDIPNGDGGGGIFVGEKGIISYKTYGDDPQIFPAGLAQEAERVPKSVPRIETGHEVNWAQACKGEATASSPFEYAAALTETMLLGVVALRARGKKLLYDGANMRFTNNEDVNRYLTREYRAGWSL